MTRPWQHVLEPLGGYLTLAARLMRGDAVAEAWNFGPSERSVTVREVVERVIAHWGEGTWVAAPGAGPRETPTLELDATKARERLGWSPRWELDLAIARTVAWHRARLREARPSNLRAILVDQIAEYARSGPVAA
jgi:CDP-glucose 4,6-dehydratase